MKSTNDTNKAKKIIGRAENISFPGHGVEIVKARIDTGAQTSSLWASDVTERGAVLQYKLFAPGSPLYTGTVFKTKQFEKTVVASSIGAAQERYKIRLLVKVKGKKIRARFTLADRSRQVYPVLIGRNILFRKFVVDVEVGKPLYQEERQRSEQLKSKLAPKE